MQFAAYKQFLDDTTVKKKHAIEEANHQIDVLKALWSRSGPVPVQCVSHLKSNHPRLVSNAVNEAPAQELVGHGKDFKRRLKGR